MCLQQSTLDCLQMSNSLQKQDPPLDIAEADASEIEVVDATGTPARGPRPPSRRGARSAPAPRARISEKGVLRLASSANRVVVLVEAFPGSQRRAPP